MFYETCTRSLSDRTEVAMILASGIIGYPLGLLYPRNARYNVTPGDIPDLSRTTGSLGRRSDRVSFPSRRPKHHGLSPR